MSDLRMTLNIRKAITGICARDIIMIRRGCSTALASTGHQLVIKLGTQMIGSQVRQTTGACTRDHIMIVRGVPSGDLHPQLLVTLVMLIVMSRVLKIIMSDRGIVMTFQIVQIIKAAQVLSMNRVTRHVWCKGKTVGSVT